MTDTPSDPVADEGGSDHDGWQPDDDDQDEDDAA